jgi:hypothetical protein
LPTSYTGRVGAFRPRRRASLTLSSEAYTGATIEEILGKIVSLRATIASGAESAAYGDKRVEYRSLVELREILNGLEEELAALLGYGGRVRQIRMTNQWDKGL